MAKVDIDFDLCLSRLESEWHTAYEASRVAGADFLVLSASSKVKFADVQTARRRLDEAEALKAQIMAKIEHLEHAMIRRLEVNE